MSGTRQTGSTLLVAVLTLLSAAPLAAAATAGAAHSTAGPCGTRSHPPARFAHVIWIFMENRSYGQVVGNSSAPYINSLARGCGLATNYHGVAHPSLPNYIAATSGGTWGIADDDPPTSHPLAVPSIFQQARSAASYEESMPSACAQGSSGDYAVKHNPEAYYTAIRKACARNDVPLGSGFRGALLTALRTNTLPAFSFVTPNICNDMHDCSTRTGDSWLRSWVPKITSSRTYRAGKTALFITWDEADGSNANRVATIVVSPYTAPGTTSGRRFTHYSLLRTTEELLGLRKHLGRAAGAPSMRAAFGLRS